MCAVSARASMSLWPMRGSLPGGHQAPAQHREPPATLPVRTNHRRLMARHHVVAGPEVQRCAGQTEEQVCLIPREGLREAAAHANESSQPPKPGTTYCRRQAALARTVNGYNDLTET